MASNLLCFIVAAPTVLPLAYFWRGALQWAVISAVAWLLFMGVYGSGIVRRLHDVGRCGWWAAYALTLPAIGLLSDFLPFGLSEDAAIAIEMIFAAPVSVGILALLVLKGQPGSNRFGPPPTSTGSP